MKGKKRGIYADWIKVYVTFPEDTGSETEFQSLEIEGRNWFWGLCLDIQLWIDVNIIGVEGFAIMIEKDEEE